MKHKSLLCAAAILLLMLLCCTACAEDWAAVYNTNSLNLRSGPGTSYQRLDILQRGEWVQLLGENGDWYYVYSPRTNHSGYASKTFLNAGNGSVTVTGTVNISSTAFLNLRDKPSTASTVIDKYYGGAVCTVLDDSTPGWYYVEIDGQRGFFSSQYIKLQQYYTGEIAWISTQNGGPLNMRQAPSSSAKITGKYSNGTQVNVLAKGTGFWRVAVNGITGYMDSSCLTDYGPSPSPLYGGYAVVKTVKASSYLHLRASASTSSKSLAKLKNGAMVEVLIAGSEWCRVKDPVSGKTGFVSSDYVILYNASVTRTAQNHGSYVNLRSKASTGGKVLMKVNSGSQVTVLIPGDEWCRVNYNGTIGYMMTRFLK